MNSRAMSALVGLFVVVIIAMTITLMMFIGDQEFSGNDYKRYELLYDTSIKGLNVGAPVTLRGVKIGEVVTVKAKLYQQSEQVLNSVIVDIYPETIVQESSVQESSVQEGSVQENDLSQATQNEELFDQLVERGLSAKLELQSILTGMLYIEVDRFGGEPTMLPVKTEYPQIPTLPNNLEALTKELKGIDLASMANDMQIILNNFSSLSGDEELHQLAGNLNSALRNIEEMSSAMRINSTAIQGDFAILSRDIDKLVLQLDKQLPETTQQVDATLEKLQGTMGQLNNTLIEVSDTVASDSPLVYQLEKSSKDIGRASRAINDLAGMLEKQPDSVLFGRQGAIR